MATKRKHKFYKIDVTKGKLENIANTLAINVYSMNTFFEHCPFDLEALKSKNRKPEIRAWRQLYVVWMMLSGNTGVYASESIERDHATGIHSVNRVSEVVESPKYGCQYIREAIQILKSNMENNPILEPQIDFVLEIKSPHEFILQDEQGNTHATARFPKVDNTMKSKLSFEKCQELFGLTNLSQEEIQMLEMKHPTITKKINEHNRLIFEAIPKERRKIRVLVETLKPSAVSENQEVEYTYTLSKIHEPRK